MNSLFQDRDKWLADYTPRLRVCEQGRVLSVGDGIAWVTGLPNAAMDDILSFADGSEGLVFDLQEGLIGAILLKDTKNLNAGTVVALSRATLSIAAGDAVLGRVLDPLGAPLDGMEPPAADTRQPMEVPSPPITARDFVTRPLYTGIKIVDTMIPIGKGQRQLLIGDEGLGRSSLALDTVLAQRDANVLCVYVLIGQKRSAVLNTIETLRRYEALSYTTLVVAEATCLPGLQHLAPFAGCALGEYWMKQGRDVLVIFDDLSTHARTYRELSLLLRRPPGREAYPGDIFSIHARLLERATCLNAAHGGGSMTALPIVETKLGELAAYIPTNLISITDGQIYLDRNLFSAGFRPAIDIALSVSRIGGQAQHPRIKEEAGRMKLDYLQFLELEVFTRFGARLEESMQKAIDRGKLLREILKQDRFAGLGVNDHLGWLIAYNEGFLDHYTPADLPSILASLHKTVAASGLTLESPQEEWINTVSACLRQAPSP